MNLHSVLTVHHWVFGCQVAACHSSLCQTWIQPVNDFLGMPNYLHGLLNSSLPYLDFVNMLYSHLTSLSPSVSSQNVYKFHMQHDDEIYKALKSYVIYTSFYLFILSLLNFQTVQMFSSNGLPICFCCVSDHTSSHYCQHQQKEWHSSFCHPVRNQHLYQWSPRGDQASTEWVAAVQEEDNPVHWWNPPLQQIPTGGVLSHCNNAILTCLTKCLK